MIQELNGIRVDTESGIVQAVSGGNIGVLDDYCEQNFLNFEIVTPRFTNILYFSSRQQTMRVCVDSFHRKIYAGKGEELDRITKSVLIKCLTSCMGLEYATGDKIIFFSAHEVDGKFMSGKLIGYCDEFMKRPKSGSREVRVIEARDNERKLTGIMMLSSEGKVLFNGACSNYKAGSRSAFVIYTGKRCVEV